jgi:hypothetical protein
MAAISNRLKGYPMPVELRHIPDTRLRVKIHAVEACHNGSPRDSRNGK